MTRVFGTQLKDLLPPASGRGELRKIGRGLQQIGPEAGRLEVSRDV
jgi:hypothetical protein